MSARHVLLIGGCIAVWYAWRAYNAAGRFTMLEAVQADLSAVSAAAVNIATTGKIGMMKTSQQGKQAIMAREGFSAKSYPDATGRSIGYGHFILATDAIVEPITQKQAEALLTFDLGVAERAVNGAVKVPLTQSQFDALVSFVYNVGAGAFRTSTMLKKLNAGDYAGAKAEFARWNKSGNVVLSALVNRRASEQAQFV